jgi:Outer membrane protein beta-barrel domain
MRSNKSGSERSSAWRQKALVVCCLGLLGAPAFAQSVSGSDWGTYVGASAGIPDFGDLGVKVYIGQQLHPYFGWEAGVTRFAREIESTPFGDVRTDFWGVSGALVGILPVNGEFSAFGKAGVMAGRKRVRGPGGDDNHDQLNLLVGVGARYALTPRAAVRAEYETFDQGNLISVGATYRF